MCEFLFFFTGILNQHCQSLLTLEELMSFVIGITCPTGALWMPKEASAEPPVESRQPVTEALPAKYELCCYAYLTAYLRLLVGPWICDAQHQLT